MCTGALGFRTLVLWQRLCRSAAPGRIKVTVTVTVAFSGIKVLVQKVVVLGHQACSCSSRNTQCLTPAAHTFAFMLPRMGVLWLWLVASDLVLCCTGGGMGLDPLGAFHEPNQLDR